MQTEVLQEFIVVARYSNFHKASKELHVSQPTLSNHISALERELGFQLFERNGGTRLTPAGSRFYIYAQRLLDELEEDVEDCKALATQNPPARIQLLGKGDSAFNEIIPSLETPFQTVPMDIALPLLEPLTSGDADILIAPHEPPNKERTEVLHGTKLVYVPIGKIRVSFLTSRNSPIAKKGFLSRQDFRDAEILIPYGNLYEGVKSVVHRLLDEEPRIEGYHIDFVQDPSLPVGPDAVPLKGLDQRIMLNYEGAATRACQNQPDLIAFNEVDGKPWETMEYLIFRAEDPNPNVQAFVKEVRGQVGDVESIGDVGDVENAAKEAQAEEQGATL